MGILNIVGMDIVEVSPINDPSDRTAILAAKLVREAILSYTKPKKG
jgi:agmatinase